MPGSNWPTVALSVVLAFAFDYLFTLVPLFRAGVATGTALGLANEFGRLGRAIEAAKLEVPIAEELALDEAANAHKRLAAGHVLGKIVLRIR